MVDSQRSKLLVRTFQVEQQATKRDENGPEQLLSVQPVPGQTLPKGKGSRKLT